MPAPYFSTYSMYIALIKKLYIYILRKYVTCASINALGFSFRGSSTASYRVVAEGFVLTRQLGTCTILRIENDSDLNAARPIPR